MVTRIEKIHISPIESVSPSLAELLRVCKLRAALSRAQEAYKFVLANPRAWLGSAYHETLAEACIHGSHELDEVVSTSWDSAVRKQYDRAQNHPLDRRFGSPETWPGYHLVSAMVRTRTKDILKSAYNGADSDKDRKQLPKGLHEQQLSGAAGKITGRPDAICGDCIIDFKTGAIYEEENTDFLKSSYVRQIRLYAFLVGEALGRWPRKGVILPMIGPQVEIQLDPAECKEEANIALAMLDGYNSLLTRARDISELAVPSPSACHWCSYQLLCPSFWTTVGPEWSNELGTAVVEGISPSLPQKVYGGSAISLSLNAQKGTTEPGFVTLTPLQIDIHPSAARIQPDDIVRIVGLKQRSDRTLSISLRTVISRLDDLPMILISSS